jgi:hypothetical protein
MIKTLREGRGRRTTGRSYAEQEALGEEVERHGFTGVGQQPDTRDGRHMGIGADHAGDTGRTVFGVLQLAGEIMVLERRRQEKQRIEGGDEESDALPRH